MKGGVEIGWRELRAGVYSCSDDDPIKQPDQVESFQQDILAGIVIAILRALSCSPLLVRSDKSLLMPHPIRSERAGNS